jgi:hypothetical protein
VALIGRDNWRWGNIAVFAGVALLVAGTSLNRQFLKELLLFRGASRRATGNEAPPMPDDKPKDKMRIR